MKQRAYPGTQAVLRAIGLLKAFPPERPERSLAELAGAAGLNRTTAYRLLTALASQGMVERAPQGQAYRLGSELLVLGLRSHGAADLRAAAHDELVALARGTRETATLEVLVGGDTLILDEAMGTHVIGSMPSLGQRWPAHATSTGKALLAHLPEAALEAFLARPLAALTPRTLIDPRALERDLERTRTRGWAVSAEELEPGFLALGAPVRAVGGGVVAAISVGGPSSRLTAKRLGAIAARLPAAAARISARLGHRQEPAGQDRPLAAAGKGRR